MPLTVKINKGYLKTFFTNKYERVVTVAALSHPHTKKIPNNVFLVNNSNHLSHRVFLSRNNFIWIKQNKDSVTLLFLKM